MARSAVTKKVLAAVTAIGLLALVITAAIVGTVLLRLAQITVRAPAVHVDADNSINSKKRYLAAFGSLVPLAKTAFDYLPRIQSASSLEELQSEALRAATAFKRLADAAGEIPVPSDWKKYHTQGLVSILELRAALNALASENEDLLAIVAGVWQIRSSVKTYTRSGALFYALLRKDELLDFYEKQLGYAVQ